jgi:membrane protease YdiL (CAAX protease family)
LRGGLVDHNAYAEPEVETCVTWPSFIIQPLRRVERESRAFLASDTSRRPDRKVIIILVAAALCLTLQRYVGKGDMNAPIGRSLKFLGFDRAAEFMFDLAGDPPAMQLERLTLWVSVGLVANVVIPMLIIRLILHERLRDYGLKFRGAFADSWVYAVLFAIAAPLVFFASATDRFQEKYPFYNVVLDNGLSAAFWRWEALYMIQFFGVEFFYRGFLVHGLKHRFGVYAIFVMMVPYCMLHFNKPMPETLAAICGAVVLGFMSLRTRSIWMGTAIHMTIAGLMDAAALWRKGWLEF